MIAGPVKTFQNMSYEWVFYAVSAIFQPSNTGNIESMLFMHSLLKEFNLKQTIFFNLTLRNPAGNPDHFQNV